jgi:5-formyltetrahydrofolate cyclo-ligase
VYTGRTDESANKERRNCDYGGLSTLRPVERKQEVRERVWALLEHEGVARFPGARGRIPNFKGAEGAARRLAELPEWQSAETVKANPDAPQLPVRVQALADGKRVYMAVPRLRERRPFVLLDPKRLRVDPRDAASIRGAARFGRPVRIEQMEPVELVVCGTVAVNPKGVRIGKGGGYSDLEFGLLADAGLVNRDTAIATTVHELQILDEDLPETAHDFRVDRVVTAGKVLHTRRRKRPRGILWKHLDEEKIASIPVLSAAARWRPVG